jgi:hypothetical protein
MSYISSTTEKILQAALHDPARLMPILGYACVITMVIAIVSDSWPRKKQLARQGKTAKIPKLPAAKDRLHSSDR